MRAPWRPVLVVILPIALLTIVAMVWLWPSGARTAADDTQYVDGTVSTVVHAACTSEEAAQAAGRTDCGGIVLRLTSGPDAGEDVTTDVPSGPGAPDVHEGDDVVLLYLPDTPVGEPYQIADHQRGTQLWVLGAAFVLAVLAFGRWRGLSALAGLAVTFAVLLFFVVPAILHGEPPLLVAIVGSAAIMLAVLYLTHGVGTSTSVAVIGTLTSLALTGALSWLAVRALHLTGVADEQANYVGITHDVNLQGLLLAGILIGSLGVLDDVTVTQAATVDELARANPAYRFGQLYRSATRVGRAHIASVVNTIILAYAGASLPLLILITDSGQGIGRVLTNQLVAQELVRSAVGTLGLISAVPITTALAALTASRELR
ncbi:YibE/F family protein [Cryptosporangium sp. NPDC048952]|uniref:YibE/F family protein n=1 Tax=Cryptosporangium sp. NPDC048952 TaxID=3363961 RepID=UPI0037162E1D